MNQYKILFKTTAWVLVFSFLYSNLLWAAAVDPRTLLQTAKASFEDQLPRLGGEAANLETSPGPNQSLVDNKNDVQDLMTSLTTQNGDILDYVNGKLNQVRTKDGSLLRNLKQDNLGNIQGADILLQDGTLQVLDQGRTIATQTPDGTRIVYDDKGQIQKTVSKDNTETSYSYSRNPQGNVTQTILENNKTKQTFDKNQRIVSSFNKEDGSTTEFKDGIIQKILKADGSQSLFQTLDYGNDLKVIPSFTTSKPFEYTLYRKSDLSLKEVLDTNQNKLTFDEKGQLKEVLDSHGNKTSFVVNQSSLSNFIGLEIQQNGLNSTYDAQGNLSSIKVNDTTIHYKKDSNQIHFIEKSDGTELYNLVFDNQGSIKNATVYSPNGEVRVYENGKLKSFKETDDTQIFYFDDKPTKLITNQKITYNFNYTPEKIEARLDGGAPDALTPIKMEYDTSFNLKKAFRQNQEILSYFNNNLQRIDFPDNSKDSQVFNYQFDNQGSIASYSVTQGNVDSFYDTNNQIQRAVIRPASSQDKALEVFYQYGKIREIKKDSVLTFKYSYQTDADGKELTLIEDLEEKSTKTYKNSVLLTSLNNDTSVLSAYEYGNDVRVSKVTVTRFGRALHTYAYSYQGDNTLVQDEESILRTYDKQKKLIFLDKDKKRFGYSYSKDTEGQEITQESLVQRTLLDGSKVGYESGRITKVERPDGSIIQDILQDKDGKFLKATVLLPDQTKKIFDDKNILEEILPDSSHIYYDQGKITKVLTKDGKELNYSYDDPKNSSSVSIDMGTSVIHYDASGNILDLKLKDIPVDIDNSTDFVDSMKYPITRYGDARIKTQDAKFGRASGYFPGSSYLSVSSSQDWSFGTGDFTIDLWVNFSSLSSTILLERGAGSGEDFGLRYSNGAGSLDIYMGGGLYRLSGWAPTSNTWTHVAVTRSASKIRGFINGKQLGSTETDGTNVSSNYKLAVGAATDGGEALRGRMDEVRVSKGIARWTGNFDPPSTILEEDPNTKLLLHFDGLDKSYFNYRKDQDSQGDPLHKFFGDGGEVVYNKDLKINSSSLTTTGLAQTKTLSGLKDLEANLNNLVKLPFIDRMSSQKDFGNGLLGIYQFGTLKDILKNGVSVQSFSTKDDNGKKKIVVKDGNKELIFDENNDLESLRLTDLPSQIEGQREFFNETSSKTSLNAIGRPQITLQDKKIGRASARFGGQEDYLSVPGPQDWNFGTGDMTIDFWVKWNATPYGDALVIFGNSQTGLRAGGDGNLKAYFNSSNIMNYSLTNFSKGNWYHLAMVRYSAQWNLYVNGNSVASARDGSAFQNTTTLGIGGDASVWGRGDELNGSMDEVRISKGIARYTANFTPSQEAFTQDSNTKLLLHFDGVDRSTYVIARSPKGDEAIPLNSQQPLSSQNGIASVASLPRNDVLLIGDAGSVSVDSSGNILSSDTPLLDTTQKTKLLEAAKGIVTSLKTPYQDSIDLQNVLNPKKADWLSNAKDSILDSQEIVTQEYNSKGTLETQTKADGTVTLFNEQGKPFRVLDSKGSILIEYSYDPEGNPSRVLLKNARDTLPNEVLKARQSIEDQRAKTLLELANQKNLATQSVKDQVAQQKQALQNQLSSLQSQYSQVASTSASGKAARNQRGDVLNQIGHAMDDVRSALITLSSQEADGYAKLSSDVKNVSDKIEADAQKAFDELARQEISLQNEILKQEVSPIVYDYFRRILGRDPSSAEYASWIARVDYQNPVNLNAILKSELLASQELKDRTAYVNTVKQRVSDKINSYLAMNDAQKAVFASSLGLQTNELIPLNSTDVQKVLSWLNSRSLHFAQSAFLSLESLLDQKGISYVRTDIAQKAILIDVLTGIISPLDDGDLVISMYALNKVAGLYGLTLAGANLSWDDLRAVYQANPTARVVAHVRENHYLIVTGMTADTITYVDPGAGADKQNQVETIKKADFLKGWKGNVTLEQTKLQSVTGYQTKTLSVQQTQKIRGAFFFFLIPLFISFAASIGGAIASVIAGIGTILAGVGTLVAGALSSIGGFLATVAQGIGYIGSAIWQGISFAASSLWGALGNVGSFLSQNVFGSLAKAGFGNTLFQNAVRTGLNFAITKGLDGLGINPVASNLISSFVSGGTIGGFNAGFTASSFIQSGVKALAIEGTQTLLQKVGLDANLSSALSLASGQFVDGILNANLGSQIVKIGQTLGINMAQYGIDKLGASLGLPALVTQAAGAPIAASLGQGLQNGNLFGQNIIQSVQQGLFNGAIAYAADFASDKITDNAILNALSTRVISGAIEGAFVQKDVFKGMYDALKQSVLGVFGADQRNILLNAISFGSLVLQNGLKDALEIHLTSIFNRQSIESIQRSGGIASALASPKDQITLPDGRSAQIARVASGEGVLFDSSNNLIGFERNGLYQTGQFGIGGDGAFGLTNGKSFGFLTTGQYYEATVQDGKVTQIKTISSQVSLNIRPEKETPGIQFNVDGNLSQGQMTLSDQITLNIANGTLDGIQILNDSVAKTAADATQRLQDFAKFTDAVFMLSGPQTNTYKNSTGAVAAVDMKLDWMNMMEKEKRPVLLSDLAFFFTTANSRWLQAVNDAAPKIVNLMKDAVNSANRFIFVPGVNTTIVDQPIGDAGRTMAQVEALSQSFDINNRRTMFFHSAGTEAGLKALIQAKAAGVDLSQFKFVFASPRVRRDTFVDYLNQAGVTSDQVLVVTAAGDYQHWPTDVLAISLLPSALLSSWSDYGNNKVSDSIRYNYLFLEKDLTSEDSGGSIKSQLEHGGMVDGSDHEYQVLKNGSRISRVRLRDLYFDFSNGRF